MHLALSMLVQYVLNIFIYRQKGDFDTAAKIIQEMKNNGFQVESRAYRGIQNRCVILQVF